MQKALKTYKIDIKGSRVRESTVTASAIDTEKGFCYTGPSEIPRSFPLLAGSRPGTMEETKYRQHFPGSSVGRAGGC